MSKQLIHKTANRDQRKRRIRSRISGTSLRPRLSVHISNMHISAQLIDDEKMQTIAFVSTVGNKKYSGSLKEKAAAIGKEIAVQAKAKKIKTVVFDRNCKLYHGRIAALAEAARKEGLEF